VLQQIEPVLSGGGLVAHLRDGVLVPEVVPSYIVLISLGRCWQGAPSAAVDDPFSMEVGWGLFLYGLRDGT
jgi:hypothetical protein